MSVAPESGRNRIMIYGPKPDGTYVVEFETADGDSLAISVPAGETRVLKHFQARMPFGLFAPDVRSDPKAQTAMGQIDTYSKYKQQVVERDFREFMAARADLRKAWHCAGSLFHLHEWVYAAHKAAIDVKYTFVDDNGSIRPVSCAVHFANSLGQIYPDFQLVRGIANASKHFVYFVPLLRAGLIRRACRATPPIPTCRGQPLNWAHFLMFQLGEVKQQADSTDVEFAVLAQSILNMWDQLFAQEGW